MLTPVRGSFHKLHSVSFDFECMMVENVVGVLANLILGYI